MGIVLLFSEGDLSYDRLGNSPSLLLILSFGSASSLCFTKLFRQLLYIAVYTRLYRTKEPDGKEEDALK